MNLFAISYEKLAVLLLPTFLRKPFTLTLLRAVACELENVPYARFMTKREDDLFYLHYNGQVCYLRAALNKYFGDIKNRADGFEIEGAASLGNWLYAYKEGDTIHESSKIILARESATAAAESAIKPVWVYHEKDINAVITGFTVRYPYDKIRYIEGAGNPDETKELYDRMVELVNYFRLVGRKPDYKPK